MGNAYNSYATPNADKISNPALRAMPVSASASGGWGSMGGRPANMPGMFGAQQRSMMSPMQGMMAPQAQQQMLSAVGMYGPQSALGASTPSFPTSPMSQWMPQQPMPNFRRAFFPPMNPYRPRPTPYANVNYAAMLGV